MEEKLLNFDKEHYGADFQAHILEQWKTALEMSNSLHNRRAASNNFFITINSLLVAFFSIGSTHAVVADILGIVLCLLWILTIQHYKTLNAIKREIIHEMEAALPVSVFKHEQYIAKIRKYKYLTLFETFIPCIFICMYGMTLLYNQGKIFA
ncbi:MAG: RipA family octameric membrane protein [Treponema sp.]